MVPRSPEEVSEALAAGRPKAAASRGVLCSKAHRRHFREGRAEVTPDYPVADSKFLRRP